MFQDWKPHPTASEVYVNSKNKKAVKKYVAVLEERQENYLAKRINENHSYIAKI